MADIGDLLGSLMAGLIRARRVADEQTAALAEYYKENPLLEGLSVPRIRIPELTIDMPFLIEDHVEGDTGSMENPKKISDTTTSHLLETLEKNKIEVPAGFQKSFTNEFSKLLNMVKDSKSPVMKESISRSVQAAFNQAVTKSNMSLSAAQKDLVAREISAKAASVGLAKPPVSSIITANIKSADVKERATPTSVVRLKITLKEEGLEWTTQKTEEGGTTHTLTPE